MTTIIVSLGSIVKTDASKAIVAFQNLANSLGLGIQVPSLMGRLRSLFVDFNLGKLSTEDFKEKISKIFFEGAQKQDDASKKTFSEQFEACWNAMCVVDEQAKELLKAIAEKTVSEPQNKIEVYSDTNSLHFSYLQKEMAELGFDFATVQTTFIFRDAKEVLLRTMVERLQEANPSEKIMLVLGQNEIVDPVLKAMTEQRDASVVEVATDTKVSIEYLEGSRITAPVLATLMSKVAMQSDSQPLPPLMIPAFKGVQAAVLQTSSPVTNDDKAEEQRDRTPSPTS